MFMFTTNKTTLKKTAFLVVLLLSLPICSVAQKLLYSEFDLKTPDVKSVALTQFQTYGDSSVTKTVFAFGPDGYLIKATTFVGTAPSYSTTYSYNANKTEVVQRQKQASKATPDTEKNLNIYHTPMGLVVGDLPMTKRNDQGQYMVLGGLEYGVVLTYQNNLINYKLTEAVDGKPQVFLEQSYNTQKQLLYETQLLNDTKYYYYNNEKLLDEILSVDAQTKTTKYSYKLDSHGNWVERATYVTTNMDQFKWKLNQIAYRKLSYADGSTTGSEGPGSKKQAFGSYQQELAGLPKITDATIQLKSLKGARNILAAKAANTKEEETKTPTTETKATCLSGNCTNGYGKMDYPNYTLEGFFVAGKANGYGEAHFKDGSGYYQGNFKNGFRDGFGVYTWTASKNYYIGQWSQGSQQGYGYTKNGQEVINAGLFSQGKQTVNMITPNFSAKKAVGNCIGDCQNGFGYQQYTNGDRYVGFFSKGARHYVGAYSWKGGTAYIGEMQMNVPSGGGEEIFRSYNQYYMGDFSQGKRHGKGVLFGKGKKVLQQGNWNMGQLVQ